MTQIDRLQYLLNQFKKRTVLVVGDVGIDRYTVGDVERISPEAPVPVVWVKEEKHKMGLAANVADNLDALGARAHLVGVVGKDHFAREFRAMLRGTRVSNLGLVEDPARRTIVKERVVSDRQQIVRIDYESTGTLGVRTQKAVEEKVRKLIAKSDVVILQDYAKGFFTPKFLQKLIRFCRAQGKSVVIDPNPKSIVDPTLKGALSVYQGVSIFKPNLKEAERLSGIAIRSPESLRAAGEKLLGEVKSDFVVITRGKDGMAIFKRGSKKVVLIPTFAREVYDVSGAGDTVITILALAMASEATIEEAAVLANLGAGVVVGKRGTATVTPAEIRAVMGDSPAFVK